MKQFKSFSELETERQYNVVENKHCFIKTKSHEINLVMLRDKTANLNGNAGTVVRPKPDPQGTLQTGSELLLEAALSISDH